MRADRAHLATGTVAGLTTFVTMACIVIVNPSILATEGTGMPFDGVLTATVALGFVMTLLMGLYAGLPFAVARGMCINQEARGRRKAHDHFRPRIRSSESDVW